MSSPSSPSMRSVVGHVRATNWDKPLMRFVGTTDVHGAGTHHPLHDVDPVVLCDMGHLSKKGMPAFGMHPHYGVIACTIVFEGGFQDGDNLGASPPGDTLAGGVYCASSGRGVCHEESTITDKARSIQLVLRIPRSKLSLPPQITKAEAEDLAEVLPGVSLLVGELCGQKSPATPEAWPDATVLRVKVSSTGGKLTLPLPEAHRHGFCIVIDGKGTVAGEAVSKNQDLVLFGAGAGGLEVAADSDADLDLFLVCGAPMADEPWVKKLWNNGFGIFASEEEANDVVARASAAGMEFSFKALE